MTDRNATALPRPLQRLKEAVSSRRAAINELNFIYKELLRLLPNIKRRVDPEPIGELLEKQDQEDRFISTHLTEAASTHGEPPEPCTCEEANALVDNVYHAERAANDRTTRASAVIHSLKLVRTYLIRAWGRLISTLSSGGPDKFLKEAHALQAREADLFRELVVLGEQLDHGPQEPSPLHLPHKQKSTTSRSFGRPFLAPRKGRSPSRKD